jgi:uncharacterized protein (TIRG00374 family)
VNEPSNRRYARLVPLAVASSLLFLVAILAWYALRRDVDLAATLQLVDWRILPLALALHISAHLFWAARYTLIANAADVPLRALQSWRIVTAGVFGGAVTPGRIGGEGLKLALLVRRGVSPQSAGRVLIADRAADLVFFMALGLVAVGVLPQLFGAEGSTARAFALAGTAMLAIFIGILSAFLWAPRRTSATINRMIGAGARIIRKPAPNLQEQVKQFLDHAREGLVDVLGRRPSLMVAAMLLTLANWLVEFGAIWVILGAFGYQVPYWAVFFVGIVLTMVANIPLTPGGSGVAEVAALALLTPLAPGLSPLFVVAWRGISYYYDLVVGGITASIMLPRRVVPLDDNA